MHPRIKRTVAVGRSVGKATLEDRISFLAAAIAFYAFVSILPLLLLILVIGSFVGGETFAMAIVDRVEGILTPDGQELLRDALLGGAGRGGATIVGTVGLLWSGLKVFRGLDIAFSQVYGVASETSFLENLKNAVIALFSIGIGLSIMIAIMTYVRFVGTTPVLDVLSVLSVFVTLVVIFLPMYYIFPSTQISVRESIPGAVFAGLGWTVLGEFFGIYATYAGTYALFGLLGAVLLLLIWFYLGAIILMVGAVINAVLADRTGTLHDSEWIVHENASK